MVSEATPSKNESRSTEGASAARLRGLRELMRARGLDAVVVRATDRYLNEYVPADESTRTFLTGFTGSMGDALVTLDRALLFVDGRYTLQAARESPDFEARQVALGQPIEEGWLEALAELASQGVRTVGVETDRVPQGLFETLARRASEAGVEVRATAPSLLEELRERELGRAKKRRGKIWSVGKALSGRTVQGRLEDARKALEGAGVDGFVVVPLDEIAWLANLRGDHFAYQATFRSLAVALKERVVLAADERALEDDAALEPAVQLVAEDDFVPAVKQLVVERPGLTLGYSAAHTPASLVRALQDAGARLVPMDSPFVAMRTRKTDEELRHMVSAFARADDVVKKLQSWASAQVSKGAQVTEKDVADKTRALFKRSGAWGLSFKVIAAASEHGAVIHYSTPDAERALKEGEMFLLDTGGYYEGGYATDLTRTFLLGRSHVKPSDEQKRLFTLVLKGAIAGMSARFPRGTRGEQLDALVRAPLWSAGLNYAHGTGHGVGVNVHEFPPRLMPGNRTAVEPGHVFSVEPGVYIAGYGGVRIENLVTCVVDPEDDGFLRVRPLTFSPLDKRLVERAMLTAHEKAFLTWFEQGAKLPAEERLTMPLPPLP